MRSAARLTLPSFAAVAAVAVVAGASAGASSPSPPCTSAHSTRVAATASTVAIRKRGTAKPRFRVTRYFGCHFRTNRFRLLAIVGEPGVFEDRVTALRLAGVFAARSVDFSDPAGSDRHANVRLVDLRTGRTGFTWTSGDHPGGNDVTTVTDLELRSNGDLAWIDRIDVFPPAGGTKTTFEVHRRNAAGETVIDSGPDIDPTSLAISADRVYWTKGASPFSAKLSA